MSRVNEDDWTVKRLAARPVVELFHPLDSNYPGGQRHPIRVDRHPPDEPGRVFAIYKARGGPIAERYALRIDAALTAKREERYGPRFRYWHVKPLSVEAAVTHLSAHPDALIFED